MSKTLNWDSLVFSIKSPFILPEAGHSGVIEDVYEEDVKDLLKDEDISSQSFKEKAVKILTAASMARHYPDHEFEKRKLNQ